MLNLALGAAFIARQMGFEPADLSTVADPKGRVDFLASKLLEAASEKLTPELRVTYLAARPLIDGYLLNALGKVRVQIPAEIMQVAQRAAQQAQTVKEGEI